MYKYKNIKFTDLNTLTKTAAHLPAVVFHFQFVWLYVYNYTCLYTYMYTVYTIHICTHMHCIYSLHICKYNFNVVYICVLTISSFAWQVQKVRVKSWRQLSWLFPSAARRREMGGGGKGDSGTANWGSQRGSLGPDNGSLGLFGSRYWDPIMVHLHPE